MTNEIPTTEVAQRQLLELLAEVGRDSETGLDPYVHLGQHIHLAGLAYEAERAGEVWQHVCLLLMSATRDYLTAQREG